MNKPLFFALVGAFLAELPLAHAQVVPAASAAPEWTVTPSVVSQYMFRGVRLSGESFQPTVEMTYGDLTAGVWASTSLERQTSGDSDPEFDFYGSYDVSLGEASSVAVGATWYTYPGAKKSNGLYKHTFEPSVALNYTFSGLRLTPKVYYDLMLEGPTAELNAVYAFPLSDLGTEVNLLGTIGTYKWENSVEDSLPDTKSWGDYWSVGVSIPFQVSAKSKVSLGWSYTWGDNNFSKQGDLPKEENSAAVGRGVVSLAYSYTF